MEQLNAESYFQRGLERYRAGDTDGAIADFTAALEHDPDPRLAAAIYLHRGAAYDNPHDSIADYSEAIRLNPEYVQAYYNRGFVRGQLGDYEGAIADFTRVLQLQPDHPQWAHIRLDISEWRKKLT
jgi:tetratricopeptide (TPR) repeat protein